MWIKVSDYNTTFAYKYLTPILLNQNMFTYLINLREHLSSTTVLLVGSVLLVIFALCVPIRCLCSEFRVVMSVTISAQKRCSVRLHLQLFVGGRISYLRYFCLFAQWCLTHIVLCFRFIFLRLMYPILPVSLCFSSSYEPYVCQFPWIVLF